MGVDFVLGLECPVKKQLSTEGMVSLVKSRSRAQVALERARAEGNNKPPSQILITLLSLTPQGTHEPRETSLQELLDESSPLDALSSNCVGCDANVNRKPFGCYGYIRYPIKLATERWLMDLLPKDLDSTAGVILQKYVKEFHYDGGPLLELRANPTFFEDRQGARTAWKGKGVLGRFSTAFSLTSSQLLEMIFCLGPLQPSHCAMLCLFLGLIPHDSSPEALMNRKTFLTVAFKDGNIPSEVPDVDAFVHLFDALLRSVLLNVPVLVDF